MGCSSSGDSQCLEDPKGSFVLAESVVTQLSALKMLKTSAGLALVGLDDATVRWSMVSPNSGMLGAPQSFALPAHIAGPWFALSGVGGANNQLVTIYVAAKAGDAPVTQVMAIAQDAAGTLVPPRMIFETVAGTNPDSIRVSVGSAPSGQRTMVAIGFDNQSGADVNIIALGENAQTVGMEILAVATKWACPFWSFGGRAQAPLNFSYVNQASKPELVVYEMQETGVRGDSLTLPSANLGKGSCPIVVPKEGGLVYSWRTDEEIRGADFLFSSGPVPSDFDSYPLANAVRFGGTVPTLVGAAGMGNNVAVLWVRSSGPELALYDQMQIPVGKELQLSVLSGNKVGPVSTISEKNAMYVTYREIGKTPQRRLVKVTCPDKK